MAHMATDLKKHIKLSRGYMRDRDQYNLHTLSYILFTLEIPAMLLSFHDSLQLGARLNSYIVNRTSSTNVSSDTSLHTCGLFVWREPKA